MLTAVWLMLLALLGEEWMRSYSRRGPIRYIHAIFGRGTCYLGIAIQQGIFGAEFYRSRGWYYCRTDDYGLIADAGGGNYSECPIAQPAYSAEGMQSRWFVEANTDQLGAHHRVVMPAWFVVVGVAGAPLLFRAAAYYRTRKLRHGDLCPGCGYDLTGNTSGVCPECGARIPAVADLLCEKETAAE